MMSRVFYYLIFGLMWTLTLLPLKVLYILSDFIFFCFYYLTSYRRKITKTNLRNSFPEKSTEEIRHIAKKFYQRLADQIIESFKLLHISKKAILKRFKYVNPELLEEYYRSDRSIMLLCGHYGTWEWMVGMPLITKYKILAVYQPPSFSDFSRIYYYITNRFGLYPVPMREIYKEIVESKSKNELTATFILGDQSPPPERIKYWTNFMNQDTPVITGYDRIAQKTNQVVIYMDIVWKKRGFYEITFRKITDAPKEVEGFGIARDYLKALEKTIVRGPELWLWSHRRWKRKRDDILE
jgi:KDO2-lipid IV(A) lauroyltransferase